MAAVLTLLSLLLLSPLASSDPVDPPLTDTTALLLLKDSFINADGPLASWSDSGSPCSSTAPWAGVLCFHGIVTGLRLGGMGLAGTIDVEALAHFKALRTVSFNDNQFSGPLPSDLGRLDALKSIYLSNNRFSGPIPDSLFADMDHLKKLWLNNNNFSGPVPSSISKAASLIELHLEDNHFTGEIPKLDTLRSLKSFSVSNNELEGAVPAGLVKFAPTAFVGNPGLCGLDGKPCGDQKSPDAGQASLESTPATTPVPEKQVQSGKVAVVSILLLVLFFALVVAVALMRSKRRESEFDTLGVEAEAAAMEAAAAAAAVAAEESTQKRAVAAAGAGAGAGAGSTHKRNGSSRAGSMGGGAPAGGGAADLIMVNDEKGVFGLADLMKAAAEVLGNGGLGSAYKAVMANGVAVVVKRMREMNRVGKDVFDAEMRRFGRLRHPNVLTPLAYHYRKEEKLVVCEFVSKGSLLYVLHGDRGPDHAALTWPTRLKIIVGITRGMAYLHAELASLDVPHGNFKSGNILLGPHNEPLIVDYGFVGLVNPSQASQVLSAYKSPEALQYRHVSPKSDVYCLGIVILELLTGKFPSQYLNNTKGGTDVVQWTASAIAERREAELLDPAIAAGARGSVAPEMLRLLRVGAACTETNPEQRPDVKEVAALVEEVAASAGGAGGGESGEPPEVGGVAPVPAPAPAPAPASVDGYAELSLSGHGDSTNGSNDG